MLQHEPYSRRLATALESLANQVGVIQGRGIELKGTAATVGELPSVGNSVGDAYTVGDDVLLYVWDGSQWVNAGSLRGDPGTSGFVVPYNYSDTTTAGVTGGQLRLNAATFTGATELYVAEADRNAVDVSTVLTEMVSGSLIRLAKDNDPSTYAYYRLTSTASLSGESTLGVTSLGAIGNPTTGDVIQVGFALRGVAGTAGPAGDPGPAGDVGPTGETGPIGPAGSVTGASSLVLLTGATPATPAAGEVELFATTDRTLQFINDAGQVFDFHDREREYTALSLAATTNITIPANRRYVLRTLDINAATNPTLAVVSGSNGVGGSIFITNTTTGSRTVTLPSGSRPVGSTTSPITLGTGATIELNFTQAGSTVYWVSATVGVAFS